MLIQINPEEMNNDELSSCVDEFVKRSMQALQEINCGQSFGVTIIAASYGEADYQIKHMARIGSEYGGGITRETNNLMLSATRAAEAWIEDQNDKPTEVRKLIEAPVEEPPVQDNSEEVSF